MSSREIWKFPIDYRIENEIDMPIGSEIVHIDHQYGKISIWASVNPNTTIGELRTFQIIGTGWLYDQQKWEYVGTCLIEHQLVWHVFELTTQEEGE